MDQLDQIENTTISIREFARRVGVADSTVRGYIKTGRFTQGVTTNDKGITKMLWPIAHEEWIAFGGGLDRDRKMQPKTARSDAQIGKPTTAPKQPGADGDDEDIPDINESKARSEYYRAETAKLEFKKLEGTLVDKAAVYDALFKLGAAVRVDLQSVPDKCVDAAMAAKTRQEAHAAIYDEIEAVLLKHSSEGALDNADDESDT